MRITAHRRKELIYSVNAAYVNTLHRVARAESLRVNRDSGELRKKYMTEAKFFPLLENKISIYAVTFIEVYHTENPAAIPGVCGRVFAIRTKRCRELLRDQASTKAFPTGYTVFFRHGGQLPRYAEG